MLETGSTLVTMATRYVGLCRNSVSLLEIGDISACLNYFGSILMAKEEGKLNPGSGIFVPLVNVDVSTTNGRSPYPDQQVIIPDLGCGKVSERCTPKGFVFD
jgi:hypothetical protein